VDVATLTDLWGDEAADIMDDAIAEIAGVCERTLERRL
jgi:hypothetical protein